MPRAAPFVLVCAVLAIPVSVQAQEQEGERPRLSSEQRDRLERYRNLTPEQRERLRELYRERLKQASPEELDQLRQRARRHHGSRPGTGGPHARDGRRQRFEGMSQDKRERFRGFVERLLSKLPEAERKALAELAPEGRAKRVEALIHRHRQQMLGRQLEGLPEGERERFEAALEGLQGPERVKKARELMRGMMSRQLDAVVAQLPAEQRQALEGLEGRDRFRKTMELVRRHFGQRVRAIREDGSLSDEEKRASLEGLLEGLPPLARHKLRGMLRGESRDRRGRGGRHRGRGRDEPGGDRPWDRGDRPRSRDGERGERGRDGQRGDRARRSGTPEDSDAPRRRRW